MNEIIDDIIKCLDDTLLNKKFIRGKNRNKFTGHCYVATETLYHLLDEEQKREFTPAILKVNGITHWFLRNRLNNEIIDITKHQFDFNLDYSNARNCSFLTKEPSKRSRILINRIYEKNCY